MLRQQAATTYLEGYITSKSTISEGRMTQSKQEIVHWVWISYPQPHFSQNPDFAYASGLRDTTGNNQ